MLLDSRKNDPALPRAFEAPQSIERVALDL
jgi:hypothetical protein